MVKLYRMNGMKGRRKNVRGRFDWWLGCWLVLLGGSGMLAASGPSESGAQKPWPDIRLTPFFEGYQGCFVLYDLERNLYLRFNESRCSQRFAPCSTFKIPNSLIGLETGVLENERSRKKWDGAPKMLKVWERDHDLASAIRYSVVWYYQSVARDIGAERMRQYLDLLDYGNRDISGGIDRFWLGNSLKISADEQIVFLAKLYRDGLPLGDHALEVTKKILVQEEGPDYRLSGKTGSDWESGNWLLGWFVGHLRCEKGEFVFALNIAEGEDPRGPTARTKAREILRALDLLPERPAKGTAAPD